MIDEWLSKYIISSERKQFPAESNGFLAKEITSCQGKLFPVREIIFFQPNNRPPQSVASCRLSARHILTKAILQAHLSKTTRIFMIYKGRHIFSPLSMPGTLLDCGGLDICLRKCSFFSIWKVGFLTYMSSKHINTWQGENKESIAQSYLGLFDNKFNEVNLLLCHSQLRLIWFF